VCASAATPCSKLPACCSPTWGLKDKPPELPAFDAFVAPASHRFAFKGLWQCNWLQAFEVGIDPAHPSFLHRYLQDETSGDPAKSYGRQFRADSVGQRRSSRQRTLADDEDHARVLQPGDPL
jgi:phenylpropionate dioxygenase-like ring-hydroxylating dioxygenase large terminal subunit